MKKLVLAVSALMLPAAALSAQSLEDLNIQIHGYATQGFLYTTQNNILTTSSSDGSAKWNEAVVNVTAQPAENLRIGVQARYFMLGNYANAITLDWAAADYRQSDKFGVRFGKVKTPSGLFNEIQDIDPSYPWVLLPQGNYPISSRNSLLAHFGGVAYGTLPLHKAGKLEYRGWAGERQIASNDGYWVSFNEEGIEFKQGLSGPVSGGALHWRTPIQGLMLGASVTHSNSTTTPYTDTFVVPSGPSQGVTITSTGQTSFPGSSAPSYFGKYEKNRLMFAAEYSRQAGSLQFINLMPAPIRYDLRNWYGMATYKVTNKLTAGAYHSQSFDTVTALGPSRYQKDWAVSGRYDFGQYLYAKAEEHFLDGTQSMYDSSLNPHGLHPDTRLTALKVGVNF